MLLYIWGRILSQHAPQFAEEFPMRLLHDIEVSQVTYFRTKLEMQGVYIPNPHAGEIIQAAFPIKEPSGILYAGCVSNASETPNETAVSRSKSSTVEPFTQTEYFMSYDSKLPSCSDGYAMYGTFDHPWSIVVGTKETFTPFELFSFPIYSARLHGSWWNQHYTYASFFACSVILGFIFGFRHFVGILFFASAADRLSHAFTWIALVDIIPGLLIIFDSSRLAFVWWIFVGISAAGVIALGGAAGAAVGAVILIGIWFPLIGRPLACVFLFGSGYFMGPLALAAQGFFQFIQGHLHLLNQRK